MGRLSFVPKPIIFIEDDYNIDDWGVPYINDTYINDKFAKNIDNSSISYEIWASTELLKILIESDEWWVSGIWTNPGPHQNKRLSFHWKKESKTLKLSIQDYRDFIYVFRLIPQNFDEEFNIWRGVWPD